MIPSEGVAIRHAPSCLSALLKFDFALAQKKKKPCKTNHRSNARFLKPGAKIACMIDTSRLNSHVYTRYKRVIFHENKFIRKNVRKSRISLFIREGASRTNVSDIPGYVRHVDAQWDRNNCGEIDIAVEK